MAVRLRDSGRVGVVQLISPDGASCTVALGSEDGEGRLVVTPGAETAATVSGCVAAPRENLSGGIHAQLLDGGGAHGVF